MTFVLGVTEESCPRASAGEPLRREGVGRDILEGETPPAPVEGTEGNSCRGREATRRGSE